MIDFGRLIAPYARKISNLLGRGRVTGVNGKSKMRTLQIGLLAGETKDGIEHFEPYGFTSEVMEGSEPIAGFFDGDRSHGVVIVVADRRYRLTSMAPGEVAIYDDQGQVVHLKRDGIVVHSPQNLLLRTDGVLRLEGDKVEIHAKTSLQQDVHGKGSRDTWTGGVDFHQDTWTTGTTAVTPPTEHGFAPPGIPTSHPEGA